MTATALPGRHDVLAMLPDRGPGAAGQTDERIDSLEIAMLIYAAQERYGLDLPLTADLMARLSTVSGAVQALREAMRSGGAGIG
jgi:acyl carrier protein